MEAWARKASGKLIETLHRSVALFYAFSTITSEDGEDHPWGGFNLLVAGGFVLLPSDPKVRKINPKRALQLPSNSLQICLMSLARAR